MVTILRTPLLLLATLSIATSLAAAQSTQSAPSSSPSTSDQNSVPVQTSPAPGLPDAPDTRTHMSPQPTGPTAVMDTSMGRITCQLFDKQAPIAVANFIGLAEGTKDWTDPSTHGKVHGKSLYDGTVFHRVIPDFMVQAGDPLANGIGDPGYFFNDEFDPDLNFDVPGRLAMANAGPNTNGSQFFITEVPVDHLNHIHTIFGQCDEHSILIVKSMARVPKDRQDKPLDPIVLKKVTIVRDGQPMPPVPVAPVAPAPPEK